MSNRFHETYFTQDVLNAQQLYYGRSHDRQATSGQEPLGHDEAEFIAARDSFYLGTVSSDGWPYIQHRGGPRGFLRVIDSRTIGFADLRGNRQLVSTGNIAGSNKVALFLMDYPNRVRLKIAGHARTVSARADAALANQLAPSHELRNRVERVMLIDVLAFDWNCAQHITPRFTEEDVQEAVAPLHATIARLESELAELRSR